MSSHLFLMLWTYVELPCRTGSIFSETRLGMSPILARSDQHVVAALSQIRAGKRTPSAFREVRMLQATHFVHRWFLHCSRKFDFHENDHIHRK